MGRAEWDEILRLEARIKRLEEALWIWDEAFATGRSEPLYIARNRARAALEDK